MRKNCWEYKKCGFEPGVNKDDCCPAALSGDYDGTNNGHFGGRCCWVVAGTLCDCEVQGPFVDKLKDCLNCSFMKEVHDEEGCNFVLHPKKINNGK